MQRVRNQTMMFVLALLLAACQPAGSQVTAPPAAAEATAEVTADATTEATVEAVAEATAEATPEATPEATVDHSTMDHAAMGDAPFDAQFIDGMIEHHEGAIAMAEQVLAESERPELRQMAEAIIAAQQSEVDQMHGWRAEWYPDLEPTMGMAMDMGAMEIAGDESKAFDQRFLEAMIDHHQGALDMAQAALEQSEHAEVRTMADAIIATQQAEIDQMRGWLSEWFGVQ